MTYPLLEGLVVAEVATSVAARFAGRLLADLGATVIALEPPGPYPGTDSPEGRMDAFLVANKRRAQIEFTPDTFDRIRRRADVVLYDGMLAGDAPLIDPAREGRAVVTVVTPYGLDGPQTHLHEDELLLFALSGIASTIPTGAGDRGYERPMQPWGHQAAALGGVVAAVASLQGWFAARRSGRGNVVDVASLDALGSTLMGEVLNPLESEHGAPGTSSTGRAVSLRGFLPCRDGYLYVSGGQWESWAKILKRPEWVEGPAGDPSYRAANWSTVEKDAHKELAQLTVESVFRAAQSEGMAAFPVNTIGGVAGLAQVRDREALGRLPIPDAGEITAPPSPIRVYKGRGPDGSQDAIRPRGADTEFARELLLNSAVPAPAETWTGQHLPLEGLRIADFSWVIAGPQSTKWLAALGAEVIKVESRERPDPTRAHLPSLDGGPEGSPHYLALNYSKKDCTLNLGTPEGRNLARLLALSSDIVIENYSTGAAERMGLDFTELSKEKPSLIMVSSSGTGRTGPEASMRAYGTPIHSYAGHTYLASWPGTPPRGQGVSWTDPVTGEVAALAMLAGLAYAQRTGRGLQFDLSMLEITMALMFDAYLEHFAGNEPAPAGNHRRDCVPHNTFQCSDGWVAIAAHSPAEWGALAAVAGMDALGGLSLEGRTERRGDIDGILDRWCALQSRHEVIEVLRDAGVCAAQVTELVEVADLDQFRDRGMIVELDKPGVGIYKAFKLPWLSVGQQQTPVYRPAPRMGQDNDEVFSTVLGLSPDEIDALAAALALR